MTRPVQTYILALLCLDIVEQNVRVTTDRAQKEKDFFDGFLPPLMEASPSCLPAMRFPDG